MEAYEKTKYDEGLVSCLQNMGNLYRREGVAQNDKKLLEPALSYHRRSLAVMDTVHDLSRLATAYGNIADVHTLLGAFDEAEKYFLRAETLSQKVGDMATLGYIYGRHAELAAKTGRMAAALRYNESALKLMIGSGVKSGRSARRDHRGRIGTRAWSRFSHQPPRSGKGRFGRRKLRQSQQRNRSKRFRTANRHAG